MRRVAIMVGVAVLALAAGSIALGARGGPGGGGQGGGGQGGGGVTVTDTSQAGVVPQGSSDNQAGDKGNNAPDDQPL
jgi:hypothetical protein